MFCKRKHKPRWNGVSVVTERCVIVGIFAVAELDAVFGFRATVEIHAVVGIRTTFGTGTSTWVDTAARIGEAVGIRAIDGICSEFGAPLRIVAVPESDLERFKSTENQRIKNKCILKQSNQHTHLIVSFSRRRHG